MEKVKKISITFVTMLLAVVVVGLCPFMSMKAEAAVTLIDDGEWHDFDTNCHYMFESASGKLTIEPKVSGTTAEIGTEAFAENGQIKELIIDGDITIGRKAFYKNTSLKKVTLRGTKINGLLAFAMCADLESVYMADDVEISGDSTFARCAKLKSVKLSEGMGDSLRRGAFQWCSDLEKIVLPQNIKTIKDSAFFYCGSLKSVTMPESLETIENIFSYSDSPGSDEPNVTLNELIFLGSAPSKEKTNIFFMKWLREDAISGPSGSLERLVVPDDRVDAYISWLVDDCEIERDRVEALIVKYSEAFPNGRDEDDDSGDGDHEGGSSDDDSRPAPPTPNQMAQELILRLLEEQIAAMDSSSNRQATIDGNELVNGLPNATMKRIADTPNAVVFFKFVYDGVHYTTAIPIDAVFDTSEDWYGPLYMMNVFPTMQETATGAVPYIPVVAPVQ